MSKFDNIRTKIRKNEKRIHVSYIFLFLLCVFTANLYVKDFNKKLSKKDNDLENSIHLNDRMEYILSMKENELKKSNHLNERIDSLPYGCPLENIIITSEFGWRNNPIDNTRKKHKGIDLLTSSQHEEVFSTADGVISFVGVGEKYGNYIIIKHCMGYKTLYAHLEKFYVQVGDNVKIKDTIALSGTTGESTGHHLHYEIIENGINKDPIDYFHFCSTDHYIDI